MSSSGARVPDGSAENIKRCIDECLRVLDGKVKLSVWQPARVDPNVPIEECMKVIHEYQQKGLVGGASLSEPSAESIRRAAKIMKVEFVETEFGLFETTIMKNGVLDACKELSIPIIAHGVLGQGILVGLIAYPTVDSFADHLDQDERHQNPRRCQEPGVEAATAALRS